jgi:hypothetical protein
MTLPVRDLFPDPLHLESLQPALSFADLEFHFFSFLRGIAGNGFGMHVILLPVLALDESEFAFGIKEDDLSLWHGCMTSYGRY